MVTYAQFVQEKLADPQIFVDQVEGNSLELMVNFHASLGLLGEVAEFVISDSDENDREELGDIRFYIQAYLNSMRWGNDPTPFILSSNELVCNNLIEPGHELVDLHKKHFMYGQPFNFGNARYFFEQFVTLYYQILDSLGVDEEELIEENKGKLDERYKSGFTTEASAIRADKQEK